MTYEQIENQVRSARHERLNEMIADYFESKPMSQIKELNKFMQRARDFRNGAFEGYLFAKREK